MTKWTNFADYANWRRSLAESDGRVHTMNHDEALKWVFSALGIMSDPNPQDKSQRDQIDDALSAPLSSYPDKLKDLASQLQLKNSDSWPKIAAIVGSPETSTVSKLIGAISSNSPDRRTITDQPYSQPQGDDSGDDAGTGDHDIRSPL